MSIFVSRLFSEDTSYEEFYNRYLAANQPCVLSASFTQEWPCRLEWISSDGILDANLFLSRYGNATVPVYDCKVKEQYGCRKMTLQPLHSYFKHLRSSSTGCIDYLKDWHFQKTPLHEDVLQSFSWSANICGRKKWFLFPPGAERFLKKENSLVSDVSELDLRNVPHAVIIQEAGEIVFVPSKWYHQVWNLEETLSINHNWLNAANVSNLWELLLSMLVKVEQEISDCRLTFSQADWSKQCQTILKADLGMDLDDFCGMLLIVGNNRLQATTVDFVLKNDLAMLFKLTDEYQKRFPDSLNIGALITLNEQLFDLKKRIESDIIK